MSENKKITEYFGKNVFTRDIMKKYLSTDAYEEFAIVAQNNLPLNKVLAAKIAEAMKDWAIENGATHYTHWFQPLTGTTAEKHDSFISVDKAGNTIMEFTGSNLRKGEADASSFPSGGIRATFEARGYTVWDYSSPAFIKRTNNGTGILYIPTAFCSYTGEALDKKTPLLRSMNELSKEGSKLLNSIGVDCSKVLVNVGGEQEYFLIDKDHYKQRADIRFTGRTLFGAMPPKGQEKNDQYYASIRERVINFMAEVNEELWKLGITSKTQHNEVAPAQHELAPIFCTVNIATDQNMLIMETLKKVADKHSLACLLHEKPFAGINGSGKHNNWSLNTDSGMNLFKFGKGELNDKASLIFTIAAISAIDEYYDLVRMSASSLGNEARLGGHEAPPTIISVYLGEELEERLEKFASTSQTSENNEKKYIKTGVNSLAELKKDTSDRNRTSPFAYTGNKFEFRMVGSSATLSTPNLILNTIITEMLSRINEQLENVPDDQKMSKALEISRQMYNDHKRIIFRGNNYSKEWEREAKKRGLIHYDNSLDAYDSMLLPKNVELFTKHKVLSLKEVISRHEIYLENYVKSANIEAETMLMIARQEILPCVMRWQAELAKQLNELKAVDPSFGQVQAKLLETYTSLVVQLDMATENLRVVKLTSSQTNDIKKQCILFRDRVLDAMEKLRAIADKLEVLTPKKEWPFPTYADILFYE